MDLYASSKFSDNIPFAACTYIESSSYCTSESSYHSICGHVKAQNKKFFFSTLKTEKSLCHPDAKTSLPNGKRRSRRVKQFGSVIPSITSSRVETYQWYTHTLCSIDELMLAACRNDQDDLLEQVLKAPDINVNFADAIGDTALHYAQV